MCKSAFLSLVCLYWCCDHCSYGILSKVRITTIYYCDYNLYNLLHCQSAVCLSRKCCLLLMTSNDRRILSFQGGIYLFELFQEYTANISLVLIGFFEVTTVAYIYGLFFYESFSIRKT
jgi:hypothetical protein